jgi:hypothetical protein
VVLTDQASDARPIDRPGQGPLSMRKAGTPSATTTVDQTVITDPDRVNTAEQFTSARAHAVTAEWADGNAAG